MAQWTREKALAHYAARCKPGSRAKRLAVVDRYLASGGTPEDHVFANYLRQLGQTMKPGTVDWHRQVIQTFFRSLGARPPQAEWRWDPMQDSDRPALSPEVCDRWLAAACDPNTPLDEHARAVLAISLVYGLRAGELAAIQPQDVEADRLYVRTLKHGQPRWVWVPEGLRDLLAIDWMPVSVSYLHTVFDAVWATLMTTQKPHGVGWHSIRRALVRDLRGAGVSEAATTRFLRWSQRSESRKMVERYESPSRTVGDGPVSPQNIPQNAGLRAVDGEVWDRHPRFR